MLRPLIATNFFAANGCALSVIASLLWSIRSQCDITQLTQYDRRTRAYCPLRRAADHPAEGRNDEATERGVIEAVVSGGTGDRVADHIRGVVQTLEESLRVARQDLLGTVGRDAWGVLDEETVPRLAVFLVWPDLTGLEAGCGAHERNVQGVPQGVAHEGACLQCIPGCGQDVPGERSPWRGTLLHDATLGLLDPYAVWRAVSGARRATERRDRDTRPVSLDTQCHVAQAVRKPREPPQPAANGHLDLEGFHLPPPRQAAVRVKGTGEQVFHEVSSRLVILPMHSHRAETCICMDRPKKNDAASANRARSGRAARRPDQAPSGMRDRMRSWARSSAEHGRIGVEQRPPGIRDCRSTEAIIAVRPVPMAAPIQAARIARSRWPAPMMVPTMATRGPPSPKTRGTRRYSTREPVP